MRLLLSLALVLISTRMATSLTLLPCSSTTDVIFVMDSSGSIASNWDSIRRFTSMAIMNVGQWVNRQGSSASSGLRFAVVQFSQSAHVSINFNSYRTYTEVADAVRNLPDIGGETNLGAGLEEAERLLPTQSDFNPRNTVIVVISDFQITSERNEFFVAQRIKNRRDATIVAVGIRGHVNEIIMRQIASENRVVLTEDHETLLNYISPLLKGMCENVIQAPNRCTKDIVLVMDASISVATWTTLKEFVALVAANLANSDQNTRLAVVTFSDTATILSHFVTHSQILAGTIVNAAHFQGLTNIADGLRKAQSLLTDRLRQRHVIIFTDGVATRETGSEATVAESMRRDGINIVAYGVGMVNRGTLQSLVNVNQQNTHVILNPTYATHMISQINSVVSMTACALPPTPCVQQQADVVLAIDASGSIVDKGAPNWRLMQNFATRLIHQLVLRYPQIRIGALTFSERAHTLSRVTSNTGAVIQAIESAQNLGSLTNLVDALETSRELLNTAPLTGNIRRVKHMILIADGEHNVAGSRTIQTVVNELESYSIRRIVVGVTNDIDFFTLGAISSIPLIYVPYFTNLNETVINSVVRATSDCPGDSLVGDIPTCEAADVIFAIDRSGSIQTGNSQNFDKIKRLVADQARSMSRRYSMVRFGLVAFSENAEIITWIKRYSNVEEFASIVLGVPYKGSHTNIAAAIRESRRAFGQGGTMMSLQIILVTDGEATVEVGQEYHEASTARSFGIKISAIAVTSMSDVTSLVRVTGSSNRVFLAPTFSIVTEVIVSVTKVACEQGGSAVACPGLPDIVFLLDISASILEHELRSAKDFITNAIEAFRRGNSNSQFGLVTFSSNAQIIFGLTNNMNDIRNRVYSVNIDHMGRTNMADGLERGQQVLLSTPARPGSNRIIIMITDGLANVRFGDELTVATTIKRNGISIVPVGVTEVGPDYNKLEQIASSRNGVVRALNFAMLNSRIQELTQIACRPTNDVYYPRPPVYDPRPPVYNTLSPPFVQPRPSVTFPPWQTPIDRPVGLPIVASCTGSHIVFLIDASRHLYRTQADLDRTKNVAITLMRHIYASKPSTKFAVVSYDSTSNIEASFSPYRTVNSLISVINSIRLQNDQDSYNSHIAIGLFEARNLISQRVNTRTTQAHIILFSNGVSNRGVGVEYIEARAARSIGIRVMAVGVEQPDIMKLTRITDDSTLVFPAPNGQLSADRIDSYISDSPCGSTPNIYYSRQSNYCPEEIIFVVDSASNGTMNESDWRAVTDFLSSIAEEYSRYYDIRGRFAAVQYGDKAQVAMRFSKDLPYVSYTLSHLKNQDTSNSSSTMAEGLNLANSLFEDNEQEKLVILITDEVADNETTNDILDKVQNLNERGIKFMVAGIAEGPQHDVFFEEIAGTTGGSISVNHYEELKNQLDSVITTACREDVTFRQNQQNDQINLEP